MPSSNVPLHILLAEDDPEDRSFFNKALKEIPIATHLTMFHDGETLMDHLHKNTGPLPDIIFLDINMRSKNGIETLSEIKENEKFKNIAVSIFTVSFTARVIEMENNLKEMLTKIGASSFIRKSSDLAQLKQVIHNELVKIKEKRKPIA